MGEESLYVSFRNTSGMKAELDSYMNIGNMHTQEFTKLLDEIKIVKTLFKVTEFNNCEQIRRACQQNKEKLTEISKERSSQYEELQKEESELKNEINDIDEKLKQSDLQIELETNALQEAKKEYYSHKSAMKIANSLYKQAFGFDINVELSEDDNFRAELIFKKKKAEVLINRKTKKILDISANFISNEKIDELRNHYEKSEDPLALICAMRALIKEK